MGLAAFGVDVDTSKARINCLEADLASQAGRDLLLYWISSPRLAALFAAPMCGTCSRARELGNGPPPLRSDAHPESLPTLSKRDQARVNEANAAYFCLQDCLQIALDRGLLVLVENPWRLCFGWGPGGDLFRGACTSHSTMHVRMEVRGPKGLLSHPTAPESMPSRARAVLREEPRAVGPGRDCPHRLCNFKRDSLPSSHGHEAGMDSRTVLARLRLAVLYHPTRLMMTSFLCRPSEHVGAASGHPAAACARCYPCAGSTLA